MLSTWAPQTHTKTECVVGHHAYPAANKRSIEIHHFRLSFVRLDVPASNAMGQLLDPNILHCKLGHLEWCGQRLLLQHCQHLWHSHWKFRVCCRSSFSTWRCSLGDSLSQFPVWGAEALSQLHRLSNRSGHLNCSHSSGPKLHGHGAQCLPWTARWEKSQTFMSNCELHHCVLSGHRKTCGSWDGGPCPEMLPSQPWRWQMAGWRATQQCFSVHLQTSLFGLGWPWTREQRSFAELLARCQACCSMWPPRILCQIGRRRVDVRGVLEHGRSGGHLDDLRMASPKSPKRRKQDLFAHGQCTWIAGHCASQVGFGWRIWAKELFKTEALSHGRCSSDE